MLNMSCSSEGFFLEKHPKLAPVNTVNDGVFLAGACQGPKDIPDTVAQAGAAAAEALAIDRLRASRTRAEHGLDRGDRSARAARPASGYVPLFGDSPRRGKGRGGDRHGSVQGLRDVRRRLSVGRRSATSVHRRSDLRRNRRDHVLCLKHYLLSRQTDARACFEPRIVAFFCNWCTYTASDLAGVSRMKYPAQHARDSHHVLRADSIRSSCWLPSAKEPTAC